MLFICGTGCWLWGINNINYQFAFSLTTHRLVELLDMQHHLSNTSGTNAYVHCSLTQFCKSSCACNFLLMDTVSCVSLFQTIVCLILSYSIYLSIYIYMYIYLLQAYGEVNLS